MTEKYYHKEFADLSTLGTTSIYMSFGTLILSMLGVIKEHTAILIASILLITFFAFVEISAYKKEVMEKQGVWPVIELDKEEIRKVRK